MMYVKEAFKLYIKFENLYQNLNIIARNIIILSIGEKGVISCKLHFYKPKQLKFALKLWYFTGIFKQKPGIILYFTNANMVFWYSLDLATLPGCTENSKQRWPVTDVKTCGKLALKGKKTLLDFFKGEYLKGK